MLRKMDVSMSSFKIKLLISFGNYSPTPPPKKTMLKSGWIISDPALTTLTRGGAIVVPNLRNSCYVDEEM